MPSAIYVALFTQTCRRAESSWLSSYIITAASDPKFYTKLFSHGRFPWRRVLCFAQVISRLPSSVVDTVLDKMDLGGYFPQRVTGNDEKFDDYRGYMLVSKRSERKMTSAWGLFAVGAVTCIDWLFNAFSDTSRKPTLSVIHHQ